jgi:hypothetical protein
MSEYNFSRETISAFHFVDCQFDAETGIAKLDYAFNQGGELHFPVHHLLSMNKSSRLLPKRFAPCI